MTDNDMVPIPEDHHAKLARLLADFGQSWHVAHQQSPACWTAVTRPKPGQMIVKVTHDLDAIRAKLERAETTP